MRYILDTSSLLDLRNLEWLDFLKYEKDEFLYSTMNITITLPKDVIAEVDALTKEKKFISRKRTLCKLVMQSLETQGKRRVARLHQRGRKTLRQCAEMLGTDVEGMMKILYDLDIPLSNGSADDVLKNLKMIREQQPSAFKVSLTQPGQAGTKQEKSILYPDFTNRPDQNLMT